MAINQQKRENLLVESTAYSRRIQIGLNGISFGCQEIKALFVGARPDGRCSFYFHEAPVIQFNPSGLIRRLHVGHTTFAASKGSLVELRRLQRGGRVQCLPTTLDNLSQAKLLDDLRLLLVQTHQYLIATCNNRVAKCTLPSHPVVGQVPIDDQRLFEDLIDYLGSFQTDLRIAASL